MSLKMRRCLRPLTPIIIWAFTALMLGAWARLTFELFILGWSIIP
jgi:hypothetical protein